MSILEGHAKRATKDAERLVVTLPERTLAAFRQHCADLGLSVDEAVYFLMEHELQSSRRSGSRNRRDLYLEFWDSLNHVMERDRISLPQNWYSYPLGERGVTADVVFAKDGRLRICCVIHRSRREDNVAIFQALIADREHIQQDWGGPLSWEERPGHLACRICDETAGDVRDRDHWPDMRDWICERVHRMEEIFAPRVREVVRPKDDQGHNS